MHFCFKYAIMALMAMELHGAAVAPARRASSVVRADTRSGRLVRSVVIGPRLVASPVVKPVSVPAELPTPGAELKSDAGVHEMVERIARNHRVEPGLVDSMIRVESNYDPYAISHKGAEGLMQLVPGTARRFGVANTFNPAQNIEGGVRYLKYLLELFGGDERLALAAYNAGEGAVFRHGGIPPYAETRNYVYQVGKRLGQSRKTTERRDSGSVREYPVIQKSVDAEGREYYRAR